MDTPGPEAPSDALRAHFKEMGSRRACLTYEVARHLCLWCMADEGLPFAKVEHPRGNHQFCSKRCAEAHHAWYQTWPKPTPTQE